MTTAEPWVELTEDDANMATTYIAAVAAIREWEAVKEKARAALVATIGEGVGAREGRPLVRVSRYTSWRLDSARFKAEQPRLYEEYQKQSEPAYRITRV